MQGNKCQIFSLQARVRALVFALFSKNLTSGPGLWLLLPIEIISGTGKVGLCNKHMRCFFPARRSTEEVRLFQLHRGRGRVSRQRRHHRQREANGPLLGAGPGTHHCPQGLRTSVLCSHGKISKAMPF